MITQETLNKWDMKISACMDIRALTEWEEEFIDSISIHREQGNELTSIYNRVSG